ncbi:hypothetical protein, partial [Klebsiella pneumoniae]|uniref:hypothetical protein n=1 Tax=Klebsiella pneumoniae TaxID=573 RepID=UPI001BADC0BF
TRTTLLRLRLSARFQQRASALQEPLVQLIRVQAAGQVARLLARIIELSTRALTPFGQFVDNVLILTSALAG